MLITAVSCTLAARITANFHCVNEQYLVDYVTQIDRNHYLFEQLAFNGIKF
jgi:hypothetical protein